MVDVYKFENYIKKKYKKHNVQFMLGGSNPVTLALISVGNGGKGVGTAIMSELCTWADQHGVSVDLEAVGDVDGEQDDDHLHWLVGWYETFGFIKQGKQFVDPVGRPAQVMIRKPEALISTEQEASGRWIAEVESVPGALAYGDTLEEASLQALAIALDAAMGAGRRKTTAVDKAPPPPKPHMEPSKPAITAPYAHNPFQKQFEDAAKFTGVPSSWAHDPAVLYIVFKESSFRPEAKSKTSSAFGLFQMIKKVWESLVPEAPHGIEDPFWQAVGGFRYLKKVYKTPERARAFWDATMARDSSLAPPDLRARAEKWIGRGYVGY